MTDERYTFEQAKIRLEEIATLARKKDTSLEKSLDLLEEGVRLANICTELVDHTDLSATATVPDDGQPGDAGDGGVAEAQAVREPDDGLDEPAGMDDVIEDVEGGATEEYEGLDA